MLKVVYQIKPRKYVLETPLTRVVDDYLSETPPPAQRNKEHAIKSHTHLTPGSLGFRFGQRCFDLRQATHPS